MPNFYTLHTEAGLAAIARSSGSGVPIALTHMAVGDGNGNPTTPRETQTALVRERYRAPVNRVYQSPGNPRRFIAELVIPASEGGFVLREIGVFDSEGALFAVGNLPDTYKPAAGDGAFADAVIRLEFEVSNASAVALVVDPNVTIATRSWVLDAISPALLMPGGTTGQIYTKLSNADGDADWRDPGEFTAIVQTLEERQTLAAGQTEILLADLITDGLSIYINGIRLGGDQWIPDLENPAALELVTPASAGDTLIAVQNEPAGPLVDPLERAQNLADVPDKAAARANLDVFSRAEARQFAPPSLTGFFARSTPPAGWLVANGAAISRTAYAELFAAIGITYGEGDGFTSFNLPDLRGEFVRGWDNGRGIDAGRSFGSAQADDIKAHSHNLIANVRDSGTLSPTNSIARETAAGGDTEYHLRSSVAAPTIGRSAETGGIETRPRNVALLPCIKF